MPRGVHIMTRKQKSKNRRGRPSTAHQVLVVPVRNERPDPRKLSRAFLALALHQAQLEVEAQDANDAGQQQEDGR